VTFETGLEISDPLFVTAMARLTKRLTE